MADLILYSKSGYELRFDLPRWRRVLALAREHGWKPSGTERPPLSFVSDKAQSWNGNYDEPCGQRVLHQDAESLGSAIASLVKASRREVDNSEWRRLAKFCLEGSFLICAPDEQGARESANSAEAFELVEVTEPI